MMLSEKINCVIRKMKKQAQQWYSIHQKSLSAYIISGLCAWYFYGMFINSIHLGIQNTFRMSDTPEQHIWVVNPLRNWFAVFTLTGLATTGVIMILIFLFSKKGYRFYAGNKAIQDSRGFDILKEGTHGTANYISFTHYCVQT